MEDKEQIKDDIDNSLNAAISDENEYPLYNITVEKGFYTVYELKRKYDKETKQIILDSDFQRESVWTKAQKSELIESVLMGLPLPIFYFNQDKSGRLIVVDGRQRLSSFFEFLSNDFSLEKLKILIDLNGKKFNDLDGKSQSQIEDFQIQAHVIMPPTPDRVKFDIFDRVNRAGTQLNKQEIRNALYQGNATCLLNEIVKSEIFIEATEESFVKNNRMKDKYILLRFIALEMYYGNKLLKDRERYEYKNDIDELLGLAMENINDMDNEALDDIKKYTFKALDNTVKFLGINAFRLIRTNGSRSPINMNVFETVMHIMKNIENGIDKNGKEIKEYISELKENEEFIDAIGNHRDNKNKIDIRYKMANEIVEVFK